MIAITKYSQFFKSDSYVYFSNVLVDIIELSSTEGSFWIKQYSQHVGALCADDHIRISNKFDRCIWISFKVYSMRRRFGLH